MVDVELLNNEVQRQTTKFITCKRIIHFGDLRIDGQLVLDMGDPKLITLADEELPKGFSVVNLLVHKLAVISTALLL